jgi:hypothetical protein
MRSHFVARTGGCTLSEHRLKRVRNSLTRMPSGFDPHELDAFQFAPSGSSSPAALGVAATAPATSNARVAQVAASLLSSPWHTSAHVSIRQHTWRRRCCRRPGTQLLRCQYSYSCTSKASKANPWRKSSMPAKLAGSEPLVLVKQVVK